MLIPSLVDKIFKDEDEQMFPQDSVASINNVLHLISYCLMGCDVAMVHRFYRRPPVKKMVFSAS